MSMADFSDYNKDKCEEQIDVRDSSSGFECLKEDNAGNDCPRFEIRLCCDDSIWASAPVELDAYVDKTRTLFAADTQGNTTIGLVDGQSNLINE